LDKLKYRPLDERSEIAAELARRAGLERTSDLMLSSEQLVVWRDLGFEVGGHTVSHPILARLSEADAYAEIATGREQLGVWLGSHRRHSPIRMASQVATMGCAKSSS
jgi:hypothetical protein